MISPTKRLIVITSAIALVTACASPTSPTSRVVQPTTATHFETDSSMCRSGYNTAEGRCN